LPDWQTLGFARRSITLLGFVFPKIADTIVYAPLHLHPVVTHDFGRQNHSITDSTVQALAARIEQNHPELVRVLMEVDNNNHRLTPSRMAVILPLLEDVVVKSYQALSSVLEDLPQEVSSPIELEPMKCENA
jgi:hypothetical protein